MRKMEKLKILKLLGILCLLEVDFSIISTQVNNEKSAHKTMVVMDRCKHYNPFVVGSVPELPKENSPMTRLGHMDNSNTEWWCNSILITFPHLKKVLFETQGIKTAVGECTKHEPFENKSISALSRLGHRKNDNTKWFCDDTLISNRYILASSQCIRISTGKESCVRLGELDFIREGEEAYPENFGAKKIMKQPDSNNKLLYASGWGSESISGDSGSPLFSTIVGGIPALPKEFPPMARLGHMESNNTKWFCGGTLISNRYVLTAAHCFYSPDGEVNRVRLGELLFRRRDKETNPEDFGVKRIIDHPDYNYESSLYNDIGLIELDRDVKLNSFKYPACLPISSGNEFSQFIAIGFGSTRFGSPSSKTLQKVKLDHFTEEQCQHLAIGIGPEKLSTGLNASSQLCAGSSENKDTCFGDSGGPLLAYLQHFPCMYYVMGVTSAGIEGCGRPNVPGIYTRVYHYLNWIKSYLYDK